MSSIQFEKICIPLWSLKEGISAFTFSTIYPDLVIGQGRRFPHEIKVEANVEIVGEDFLIDIKVESEGEFVCDRCGEEFRRTTRGKVKILFTFDKSMVQGEGNDDVKLLLPSTQEIDITQDVFDALLLSVSAKCLCKEGCLGLCSHCGTNLNRDKCSCLKDEIDPRWEALKDLKFKDSQ